MYMSWMIWRSRLDRSAYALCALGVQGGRYRTRPHARMPLGLRRKPSHRICTGRQELLRKPIDASRRLRGAPLSVELANEEGFDD